jgi:hypothetical protein
VVYFLLQIVFSLESSFRCTSPILGEIGGNLTDMCYRSNRDTPEGSVVCAKHFTTKSQWDLGWAEQG